MPMGYDVVMSWGQSNAGPSGDLLSAWPLAERTDAVTPFAVLQAGGWGTIAGYNPAKGLIPISIAARMKDAGLNPAIICDWRSGYSSAQLLGVAPEFAAYCLARLKELTSIRSITLVWSQGEGDVTGDIWKSNTAQSLAYVRSALGIADLRVCIIRLANTYTPGPGDEALFNLRNIALGQDQLVAGDIRASIINVPDVTTVQGGIHLGQYDLNRQAALIAPVIEADVALFGSNFGSTVEIKPILGRRFYWGSGFNYDLPLVRDGKYPREISVFGGGNLHVRYRDSTTEIISNIPRGKTFSDGCWTAILSDQSTARYLSIGW